ncbi:MAG: hypothetical protein KDD44_14330, partial [Bdellovibrionales bacterium]|nr:hypothetical protein [Bdellovibrionales bacterium]
MRAISEALTRGALFVKWAATLLFALGLPVCAFGQGSSAPNEVWVLTNRVASNLNTFELGAFGYNGNQPAGYSPIAALTGFPFSQWNAAGAIVPQGFPIELVIASGHTYVVIPDQTTSTAPVFSNFLVEVDLTGTVLSSTTLSAQGIPVESAFLPGFGLVVLATLKPWNYSGLPVGALLEFHLVDPVSGQSWLIGQSYTL